MAYTVEFLKTAEEELAKLPKDAQRQIMKKVEGLKDDPRPAVVKQLKSPEKFLRLRVGDYRVIYLVEGKHLVVLVVSIGARKDVYDRLEVLASRVKKWRRTRA
ncbi:MAG: type II toxin-antitoxin system mRNA interferase toxin, RelE/StbE family [Candidatus Rokuibacteriota bacterium]|nr:MAG: type II toxin-antitoxin system mRNA interferase toxin, RelE/StbE family [Candidatus Rokubacteria bacterium]